MLEKKYSIHIRAQMLSIKHNAWAESIWKLTRSTRSAHVKKDSTQT